MKILVVSDSHGNTGALMDLYQIYPDMDLYLDAGDSENLPYALFPFETVKGNCDHYSEMYLKRVFSTPFGKILLAHYPINDLPDDIKIFIHGHTHKIEVREEEDKVIFCPGSISFSRDKKGESYLLLNIEEGKIDYEFISLINKKVLLKGKIR